VLLALAVECGRGGFERVGEGGVEENAVCEFCRWRSVLLLVSFESVLGSEEVVQLADCLGARIQLLEWLLLICMYATCM
jgi:hypothetical protein